MKRTELLIILVVALLQLKFLFTPNIKFLYFFIILIYFFAAFYMKQRVIYLIPLVILSPIQVFGTFPIFFFLTFYLFFYLLFKNTKFNAFLVVIIITIISYLITRLVNIDNLSLSFLTSFLKAVLLIFVFLYTKYDRDILIKTYFISTVYLLLYKLVYANDKKNINLYIVSNNLDSFDKGKNDIFYNGEWVNRLVLPLQDPNYSVIFLIIGIGTGLYLLKYKKMNSFLTFFGISIIYIQILYTYSRTGMIVSMLLYILSSLKLKLTNVIILSSLSILSWFYISENEALLDRIMSIKNDTNASDRSPLWIKSLNFWSENLVFGNGIGEVYRYVGDASHNTFIHLLAEIGIVGLSLLIFLYYYICKYLVKVKLHRLSFSLLLCFLITISMVSFLDLFLLTFLIFIIFLVSSKHSYKSMIY